MPVETLMVIPGDRLGGEPAVCTTGTLLREDPVSSDHQAQWDTLIGPDFEILCSDWLKLYVIRELNLGPGEFHSDIRLQLC